jgi:hypothetical protein
MIPIPAIPERRRPETLTNPDHPSCVACRHRLVYVCPCKPATCRIGGQPGNEHCKPEPLRT